MRKGRREDEGKWKIKMGWLDEFPDGNGWLDG